MSAPAVRGHRLVRHDKGDWRCACGVKLSGGPYGSGRMGARDVMRFHRADLMMRTPQFQARLAEAHGEAPRGEVPVFPVPDVVTGDCAQLPEAPDEHQVQPQAGAAWAASYIQKACAAPLRWMVWPRQWGKTHQLLLWWLEDPEGRVIITMDEHVAQNTRQRALEMLGNGDYQGPLRALTTAQWTQLARVNIVGIVRWQNTGEAKASLYAGKRVALDELSVMIDRLAGMPRGAHVEWIASSGVNEPPPEGLAMNPQHARALRLIGGGSGGQ